MGENEYIQLNDLLTKYRTKCLQKISTRSNESDK